MSFIELSCVQLKKCGLAGWSSKTLSAFLMDHDGHRVKILYSLFLGVLSHETHVTTCETYINTQHM